MPAVQDAIAAMGITSPTPIQRLAIGPVLEGRDVIAKAETGTGKTLAFGAPMMSKIDASRASVLGLVLCPTRELAQQVASVLEKLGESRGIKVALIVGGEPMGPQIDALKRGAQIVVGTPGRVIDLYGQRFLAFPWTEFVALDEADQMLEIGFIDDVRKILSYTPEERQTMLFSATFPDEVLRLAREATRNPVEVATAAGHATVKTIHQSWMECARADRALALTRLIEQSTADDVFLVFCDRRTEVDQLMRQLERLPFSVKALHGGFDQASRFRVMSAFRTGEVKALVATDVASRGLDVHLVSHVVNYSVPQDAEDYTHRIGRTGRAGREGTAITLVTPEQVGRWRLILRQTKWDVVETALPERSGRGRPAPRVAARSPHAADGAAAVARELRAPPQRDEPRRRSMRAEQQPAGDSPRPVAHAERRPHAPAAARGGHRGTRGGPQAADPATAEGAPRTPRFDAPRAPQTADAAPARRPHAATPPSERPSAAPRARPAAAPEHERPRREMSTRERLRLEREGRAPHSPPPKAQAPSPRAPRTKRPPRPSPPPR
ncbi:MAG: DEAD/DEAH box helicase [Planctomycetes bacterium]|nr:DEAD/DEAH box helicase [Planctomycetota bacterium]